MTRARETTRGPVVFSAMVSPMTDEIVAVARGPLEEALGAGVALHVDTVKTEGDWAFALARFEGVDLTKTALADAAKEGLLSNRYAALLKRSGAGWALVASVIGPTDPAWLAWADEHDAPASLFATSD